MPAVVLLAALNQGGCSDLKTIDRQTDALIRSRSDWVGGDPAPPSSAARNWPDGRLSGPERRRLTETEPTTRNPSARELRYDVADEARDVAGRLQAYQQAERADALELDLPAAWRQSQVTGREFLIAQDDFILSAIRLLVERHLWDPRLFATSTLSFDSAQDDGNVSSTLALINEVGVTQRLPYGGEVAARWVWNATEDLRSRTTGQYVQASELILEGSVPLLRGAGTVAREGLIQAERDLIYAARDFEQFRREYLVSIARDYFALVQQEQGIENLRNQLKSLRGLEEQQRALYEAGLIAEFELNIASSEVVSATANLAGALESLVLATDRFAIRLGLPVGRGLALRPVELVIPEPEVTPDRATELALAYRLDLQNRRDQLDDARRGVVNARNGLLPDLDLSADVAFPTDADEDEGGVVYEPDDVRYGAAVTFGVPLDRRNERLALRAATIALARADRDLDRVRDEAVVEARARVREIDRARFDLRLREQAVEINLRRLEEQILKADLVTPQQRVDTENALLAAQNARDQAATDLRNAVLDYLLATGQLRVARDGTFLPLPGMEAVGAEGTAPATAEPPPSDAGAGRP
ncbi:MAG TPA: TolC family protein [Phycisphaerales bacterium]|nr:TolC family protein [Phycisphaerales bacterium]